MFSLSTTTGIADKCEDNTTWQYVDVLSTRLKWVKSIQSTNIWIIFAPRSLPVSWLSEVIRTFWWVFNQTKSCRAFTSTEYKLINLNLPASLPVSWVREGNKNTSGYSTIVMWLSSSNLHPYWHRLTWVKRRCQIEVQVESGRRPKSKVSFQG